MFVCRVSDVRCIQIIKALCFFYYILILPFILLGKFVWWRVFVETAAKRKAAEKAVIKAARKKGTAALEELGVVDIEAEMRKNLQQQDRDVKRKRLLQQQQPMNAQEKTVSSEKVHHHPLEESIRERPHRELGKTSKEGKKREAKKEPKEEDTEDEEEDTEEEYEESEDEESLENKKKTKKSYKI